MADVVIHWEFQRCVKTMGIGIDREISWWRRSMNLLTSEQGLAKGRLFQIREAMCTER